MQATKTYLVEVAPVSKTTGAPLSYFSTVKLSPGALVRIPLRKGLVTGLVLSSKDARHAKSAIRHAGFLLKKIRKQDILAASVAPATLAALSETARYYATSVGTLFGALVPKLILSDPETFLPPQPVKKKAAGERSTETILLQMESEERFGQYRALVRQAFARNASVLFLVPTHLDALRVAKELSKGIAEFVKVFTLEGKPSENKKIWLEALQEKHPILLITTPTGLLFPRSDIDTIIIERANSRAYRTLARPYLDLKFFPTVLARVGKDNGVQLVLGDAILPVETLWREKNGEYGENSLIRWRLPGAPARLVDASSKANEHGRFEIFSRELKQFVASALSENVTASGKDSAPGRIFLFGARKGLAPTTVCGDCGTVLPCKNCGAPVVLHRRNDATVYICHACGGMRESSTLCGSCKSWKLVPLGIGTEEIARQCRAFFPKTPVHVLDKDHAPNEAKARNIVRNFEEKGGILVGTELTFFHLEPLPYSAIVSVDALFSVPDFHIHERIFYLVSRLRELTTASSLIQTRNIGKQILAWAASGNILDFYQNEIAERESFSYPPFSLFVKITVPKGKVQPLRERFHKWHPDVLRDSLVIRISRAAWPDEELLHELSLLTPEFSIRVDPESIL